MRPGCRDALDDVAAALDDGGAADSNQPLVVAGGALVLGAALVDGAVLVVGAVVLALDWVTEPLVEVRLPPGDWDVVGATFWSAGGLLLDVGRSSR